MVGGRVADEDEAGVVRHVEPLVGVGRPRVRPGVAAHQAPQRRDRRRPDPERPVDVDPRAALVGDRDQLVERVECAGVDVAGLGADDDRSIDRGERLAEGIRSHPALVVRGDPADPIALATESEHLERGVDRDVRPFVGDDRDRRGALQSLPLDVPADASQDAVACRGERREVGHRRPGHEPDARLGRQPEQLDEPAAGDLLGDRRGRRDDVQAGVLVPGAGQPVGAERGRRAAADDEAEVARTGTRDEARVGGGRRAIRRRRSRRTARPGADRPSPRAGRPGRPVHRPAGWRASPGTRRRSRRSGRGVAALSVMAGPLRDPTGRWDATGRASDATVTVRPR